MEQASEQSEEPGQLDLSKKPVLETNKQKTPPKQAPKQITKKEDPPQAQKSKQDQPAPAKTAQSSAASSGNQGTAGAKKEYSWNKNKAAREELRKLIRFMDMNKEFAYRDPGQIKGHAFQIANCNECDLYVHDHTNQVTVDKCVNSNIVLGPACSSVFVRNCTDCKLVIYCQQLRMRDCFNCEIMLYSQTEVSISQLKSTNRLLCTACR